jgi:hypothetical protein
MEVTRTCPKLRAFPLPDEGFDPNSVVTEGPKQFFGATFRCQLWCDVFWLGLRLHSEGNQSDKRRWRCWILKEKICLRNPAPRRRPFPGFEDLLWINSLNQNQKRHGDAVLSLFEADQCTVTTFFEHGNLQGCVQKTFCACQKVIWASYDHIQSNARAKPPNAPTWEDLWQPSDLGLLVSWIN